MREESYPPIFIPGNVPSSKNSRIWTGRRSIKSKLCQTYITNHAWLFAINKPKFISMLDGKTRPYLVGFHLVRDSNRRFDFCNVIQILQDMMVKYEWIIDDNCSIMFPVPLSINDVLFSINKDNPGVFISVI